jgi:hypothetical protein
MKLFGVFSAVFCNILLLILPHYFSVDINIENDLAFIESIPLIGYMSFVALFCLSSYSFNFFYKNR